MGLKTPALPPELSLCTPFLYSCDFPAYSQRIFPNIFTIAPRVTAFVRSPDYIRVCLFVTDTHTERVGGQRMKVAITTHACARSPRKICGVAWEELLFFLWNIKLRSSSIITHRWRPPTSRTTTSTIYVYTVQISHKHYSKRRRACPTHRNWQPRFWLKTLMHSIGSCLSSNWASLIYTFCSNARFLTPPRLMKNLVQFT